MFRIVTDVPEPSDGVTGLGSKVTGSAPRSVPRTMGLVGSFGSATVEIVTCPENAWFRLTRKLPALATVPVAGRLTDGAACRA